MQENCERMDGDAGQVGLEDSLESVDGGVVRVKD